MRRSALRISTALLLSIAMLIACSSCSGDGKETTGAVSEPEASEVSDSFNGIEFEEHDFDKGVCKDCGKDWQTCLYLDLCNYDHVAPGGSYVEINLPSDDGNVELVSNGKGFMLTYDSKIENDVQLSYTLRSYEDSFDDNGAMVYAVDMSLHTHYNKLVNYPDSPQITFVTTYECYDPQDIMKAYKTGDIFNNRNPFIAYYDTDDRDRKSYTPDSYDNDMTLEEMFEGSKLITREEFYSICLDNYKNFLGKIDSTLNNFKLSVSDIGIDLNE